MLDELATSLKGIVDKKPSDLDGYPYELYKATWDFVGPDLFQVYKEVVKT
jgi:hypothetical protein